MAACGRANAGAVSGKAGASTVAGAGADGRSGAGFSASVQPWTRYIIQSSINLTGWTYLMQAASSSNTLSVSGLPVTNEPAVFLRALTPP